MKFLWHSFAIEIFGKNIYAYGVVFHSGVFVGVLI